MLTGGVRDESGSIRRVPSGHKKTPQLVDTEVVKTVLLTTTMTMPPVCEATNFPFLVGALCLVSLLLSLLDDNDDDDDEGGKGNNGRMFPIPISPSGGGGGYGGCSSRSRGFFIPQRRAFLVAATGKSPPRVLPSKKRLYTTKNVTMMRSGVCRPQLL